jgi:putative restriction endonuclease
MQQKVLTAIRDDTEEAPWMVMGTPRSHAAAVFYDSLRTEMASRRPDLFVAMMLPIWYFPVPGGGREQLAPDILVAPVPTHGRSSYRVDREGKPPSFVLEVVSPESATRDLHVKPPRYERMGVREYALFAPAAADSTVVMWPQLQGYRRDPTGSEFIRWDADAAGRLYSEVLDLWLVVRAGELRAQRPNGSWLPTLQEAEAAQRELEEEVARLRAELEQR